MAIASATYDGHRTGASSDPESSGSEVLEEPTNKVSEVDNAPEQEFKVPGYLEWETKEEECHFEVMKLIEENLQQQAELVRRNEEKRGIIKRLQMEIEVLKTEVRTPQECPKIDLKRTQSTSSKSIPTKKPGLGVIRKAIMTFSRACH
ncbi:hypothetical protein SAY86_016174 [Trapa natans]|uniref:Uncharacterized protein n=1 Tax=Trapa natans TaxID=22666 RepID=A0AAN7QWX4_TRANT|nr:hypothetical protein SAY86_016174 [Trapa natans]